jgi:hypothetical protein
MREKGEEVGWAKSADGIEFTTSAPPPTTTINTTTTTTTPRTTPEV